MLLLFDNFPEKPDKNKQKHPATKKLDNQTKTRQTDKNKTKRQKTRQQERKQKNMHKPDNLII